MRKNRTWPRTVLALQLRSGLCNALGFISSYSYMPDKRQEAEERESEAGQELAKAREDTAGETMKEAEEAEKEAEEARKKAEE